MSCDSESPRTPILVCDSHWVNMLRNLHKAEELKWGSSQKQVLTKKKGWSEKVKLSLSRKESYSSPAKWRTLKSTRASVKHRHLKLSQQLGSDEGAEETSSHQNLGQKDQKFLRYVQV